MVEIRVLAWIAELTERCQKTPDKCGGEGKPAGMRSYFAKV
jgi:hypothetical protein